MANWNEDVEGVHYNSPTGMSTRASQRWTSVASLAASRKGDAAEERDPVAIAAQKLIAEQRGMEKALQSRLLSSAEQSEALQFARKRAQMIKGSLGPITPFAPREITRRSDFGLGKAPLPEIRSLPRRKSAAEEIERLRRRLGWKTRPSRSGKEDEEEKGNETSDVVKLAKKIVDKDGRRPDDGEFVTCMAESRSNPYELNVVSTEKAKACGTYYTITATAVTRSNPGKTSEMVSSLRWLWEKNVFEKLIKIRIFEKFRLWKAFKSWQSVISGTKTAASLSFLVSHLFACDSILGSALLAVQSMCEDFCTSDSFYGFHSGTKGVELVSVDTNVTYTLDGLIEQQTLQIARAKAELDDLRTKVIECVYEKIEALVKREQIEKAFEEWHDVVDEKDIYVLANDDKVKGGKRKIKLKPLRPKPCYADMVHWKEILQSVARFVHRVDLLLVELLRRLVHKGMEAFLYHVIRGAATVVGYDDERRLEEIGLTPDAITSHIRNELEKSRETIRRSRVELLGKSEGGVVEPLLKLQLVLDVSSTASAYLDPSINEIVEATDFLTSEMVAMATKFEAISSSSKLETFLDPAFTKIRYTRYDDVRGPDATTVFAGDVFCRTMTQTIKNCMTRNLEKVEKYCEKFHRYIVIVDEARSFDVDSEMIGIDWDPHRVESVFIRYCGDAAHVDSMQTIHRVGFLIINALQFRSACSPYPHAVVGRLREILPPVAARKNDTLLRLLKDANGLLSVKPVNVPEFVDRLALLTRLAALVPEWERDFTVVSQLYAVGMQYKAFISAEEHALFLTLGPAFGNFKTALNDAEADRPDEVIKFSSTLDEQIGFLWKEVLNLKSEIQNPVLLDAETDVSTGLKMVEKLDDQLRHLDGRARTCADYQRRFGSTPTAVRLGRVVRKSGVVFNVEIEEMQSELSGMTRDLGLKKMAWESINSWQEAVALWTATPLDTLDIEDVQETVTRMTQTHYLLEKTLPGNTLIPLFSSMITQFKLISPIVIAICSPALRERHWNLIKDCIGQKIAKGKGLTITKLEALDVFSHRDRILEIANQASNEAALEHMLQKIVDTWITTDFAILAYKNQKDVFIIGGTDDLVTMLEESLVTMTIIRGSPYVGPIKHAVDDWSRRLNLFSHTLDQWLTCQRKWVYLESIFSATDIQRQLPNEYLVFNQADRSWKEVMRMTADKPNAVRAACVPGVLESLQCDNAHFDRIQKCLEDYLEMKRVAFPRFYFLSNDELLDILSNARNPNAIQGHLVKCFTNVRQLEMIGEQQAALTIKSMISAEGESVSLTKNLRARGNVETWLSAVESAMFSVIRKGLKESLSKYEAEKRLDWVLRYPGQVVLTSSQMMWTQEVLECLLSNFSQKKLLELKSTWISHLNDLVQLISMPLRLCQEEAVVSLVMTDVHNRDIISSLIESDVSGPGDFEWTRHLRYSWDKADDVCFVHQGSTTLEYGCEYLGCPPRLVVTPLTDRCYLTLMEALHCHLGGSPAGPAGTGKTETVKDLAKAVGKHCFVFNCSEGINYQMMGRFFSGMVQCGSWCCLDEFNRIDVEVLSVIAQQLQTIKTAKDQHLKTFYFQGKEMKLSLHCCPFVTMNPGYAGRVELPDNLKSLFRPVAMMTPDNEMIAEIVLYSQGFTSAALLSRKIVKLFELASGQMSNEHHYDFGLRAIKLVLVMAGSYKRSRKGTISSDFQSETRLLIQALRDANRPKLLVDDAALLDQLIVDLFPGLVLDNPTQSTVLKIATELCLQFSSLEEWQSLVEKCDQFYKTLQIRHGVMLVGPTGGGKTTVRRTLAQALNVLHSENAEQSSTTPRRPESRSSIESNRRPTTTTKNLLRIKGAVEVMTIYPKCVTLSELYGHLNADTLEWTDGLLSHAVRQFAHDSSEASLRKMQMRNKRPSIASLSESSRPTTPFPATAQTDESRRRFSSYGPSVKTYIDDGVISWDDVNQFVASDHVVAPVGWRWLVLDGPVDTLWVENLNTTLDDSKVLCLTNGERIALESGMRLVFEVDDLSHASLSTVSRCSMVYMDPADLGWRPYVQSWAKNLPSELPDSGVRHILALFDLAVDPGLEFLNAHKHSQFVICPDLSVVSSLCSIYASLLDFIASRGGFSVFNKEERERAESASEKESEEGTPVDDGFKTILSPIVAAQKTFQTPVRLTYLQRRPDLLYVVLGRLFVYAYTWSFGGMLVDNGYSEEGDGLADFVEYKNKSSALGFIARGTWGGGPRSEFDAFVHKLFKCDPPLGVRLPPSPQTVFSFYVDFDTGSFKKWEDLVPIASTIIENSSLMKANRSMALVKRKSPLTFTFRKGEIGVVPTVDTLRYSFLINLLVLKNRPLLFTGSTGVGKTTLVKHALRSMEQDSRGIVASVLGGVLGMSGMLPAVNESDEDEIKIQSRHIFLSAFVTAARLQSQMENHMAKIGKGVVGSERNRQLVLFLDDVNVVQPNRFGVQPPLEVVRQLVDARGLHDTSKLAWKEISGVTPVVGCGSFADKARSFSPRFLRHFSVVNYCHPGGFAMQHIYEVVFAVFLERHQFAKQIISHLSSAVSAIIYVYQCMATQFKPSPGKYHYCFNMKDLSRVVLGFFQIQPSVLTGLDVLVDLVSHETQRVFADRLVDAKDRRVFYVSLSDALRINFKRVQSVEQLETTPLVFADFLDVNRPSATRQYSSTTDVGKLGSVLDETLVRMNLIQSKEEKLVFFDAAVEHAARCVRVFQQANAHLLMIGVGGVGKKSLCRLAAFICQYELRTLTKSGLATRDGFRDDLKKLYRDVGVDGKSIILLLTDAHLTSDDVVEDLNEFLASGEIYELFDAEELELLLAAMPSENAAAVAAESRDVVYAKLVRTVRRNLHVCLTMSPAQSHFQRRCVLCPALLRQCTLDWYDEWPPHALQSVAQSLFYELEKREHMFENISRLCVAVHLSVRETNRLLFDELNRRYYASPTSFLHFVDRFVSLLRTNESNLMKQRRRLQSGLDCLSSARRNVDVMQREMEHLRPVIAEKARATELLLAELAREQEAIDRVRSVVQEEESRMAEETRLVEENALAAQRDLDEAFPALEAAVLNLDALDKTDIAEIRVYVKPPEMVMNVMAAVCVLLKRKPDWTTAKQLLADPSFLNSLVSFDKDNVADQVLDDLRAYTSHEGFSPKHIGRVSAACRSMCAWVLALQHYVEVFKIVEPKKRKCALALNELQSARAELKEKQKNLSGIEEEFAKLEKKHGASAAERDELKRKQKQSRLRIKRARILVSALAEEEVRWSSSLANLEGRLSRLHGDALYSAASLTYLGPFSFTYRQYLTALWRESYVEYDIGLSDGHTMISSLATDVELETWHQQGLPLDSHSIENGVLVTRKGKWPLIIDPQGQAQKWLEILEKPNGLIVVDASEVNFLQVIERAIRIGQPVLLHNVGESINSSLQPVLRKDIVTRSGESFICIGDQMINYSSEFRLYLCTSLANPDFPPELSTLVSVVNFSITFEALKEQLLSDVVLMECPTLEEQRAELTKALASDRVQLSSLEDRMLDLLQSEEGHILDRQELVQTLQESKKRAEELSSRVAQKRATQRQLEEARAQYLSVATRGSILYFVISELSRLNVMYNFSLDWFKDIFFTCCGRHENGTALDEHLRQIVDDLTVTIYKETVQGLFAQHHLPFAFLLCSSVLRRVSSSNDVDDGKSYITDTEWNVFLQGSAYRNETTDSTLSLRDRLRKLSTKHLPSPPTTRKRRSTIIHRPMSVSTPGNEELNECAPFPAWMTEQSWKDSQCLEKALSSLSGLCFRLSESSTFFTSLQETENPYTFLLQQSVDPFWNHLTSFQRLLVIKTLRPKSLLESVHLFITEEMGSQFVSSPVADLLEVAKKASSTQPIILILSAGCDPASQLLSLSRRELGSSQSLDMISLGRNQGHLAKELIQRSAIASQKWVFLQNCHLAASWMPALENLVTGLATGSVNPTFRLWLSSMPDKSFPQQVLRRGIKVTVEPPEGISANLQQNVSVLESTIVGDNPSEWGRDRPIWCQLLYSLCIFHAVVVERKKFGSFGWNVAYEFSTADLEVAVHILRDTLVSSGGQVRWNALRCMTGDVVYGGRVTDEWDRRCMKELLAEFYSERVESNCFMNCPNYPILDTGLGFEDFSRHIRSLPLLDQPEIFGMHPSVEEIRSESQRQLLLESVLRIQPRTGEKQRTATEVLVLQQAQEILDRLPDDITEFDSVRERDIDFLDYSRETRKDSKSQQVPTYACCPLDTVLLHEVRRFNALLSTVRRSAKSLVATLKGEEVLSDGLQNVFESLSVSRVPQSWLGVSYASSLTIGKWVSNLVCRVDFFRQWALALRPSAGDWGSGGALYPEESSSALSALKAVAASSGRSKSSSNQTVIPSSFWLSAFFYPKGLLTAVLQCFARKNQLPIDELDFSHRVTETILQSNDYPGTNTSPEIGIFVHGLFLEGAEWHDGKLTNLSSSKYFQAFPQIQFIPGKVESSQSGHVFDCPLYQSSERGLARTVTTVKLPANEASHHWILRGTALVCQAGH